MSVDSRAGAEWVHELLSRPGFLAGLAQAHEQLASLDTDEQWAGIRAQLERLESEGFSQRDDWVASLIHVARVAQFDPTGMSAHEIEEHALAWKDRERIRASLREDASATSLPSATYQPFELAIALGVTPRTINTYAKAAGVKTPSRGKKDHRYSESDRRAICGHVATYVSNTEAVKRARTILAETENKQKGGN